ncbi:MAG: methyltransferase domain-containing protein [Chthoniobacteraceae bacterium]
MVENVYEVTSAKYGFFDLVLFLGVLYHLRNPMAAFDRVRSVMKPDAGLFVETHLLDNAVLLPDGSSTTLEALSPALRDLPIWQFYSRDRLNSDATNKWAPNMEGLKQAVEEAEFEVLDSHILGTRGFVKGRAVIDDQVSRFRRMDSAKSI